MSEIIIGMDLETTSLSIEDARIIQIALLKVQKWKVVDTLISYVNPECSIPSIVTDLTGISDETVKGAPTFSDKLEEIRGFFDGNFIVFGHNVHGYDIPILVNEVNRVNPKLKLSVQDFTAIDTLKIWRNLEKRTLEGAYERFCGKELSGGHDAEVDIKANLDVLKGMIKSFNLQDDIKSLSNATIPSEWVGGSNRFQ